MSDTRFGPIIEATIHAFNKRGMTRGNAPLVMEKDFLLADPQSTYAINAPHSLYRKACLYLCRQKFPDTQDDIAKLFKIKPAEVQSIHRSVNSALTVLAKPDIIRIVNDIEKALSKSAPSPEPVAKIIAPAPPEPKPEKIAPKEPTVPEKKNVQEKKPQSLKTVFKKSRDTAAKNPPPAISVEETNLINKIMTEAAQTYAQVLGTPLRTIDDLNGPIPSVKNPRNKTLRELSEKDGRDISMVIAISRFAALQMMGRKATRIIAHHIGHHASKDSSDGRRHIGILLRRGDADLSRILTIMSGKLGIRINQNPDSGLSHDTGITDPVQTRIPEGP